MSLLRFPPLDVWSPSSLHPSPTLCTSQVTNILYPPLQLCGLTSDLLNLDPGVEGVLGLELGENRVLILTQTLTS